MKPDRVLVPLVCLLLGLPALAFGQLGPDAAQAAMFHLGPLSVTPKLAIQNMGVDTNVFNSSDAPVRDLTAVLTPGVNAWLRIGRLRLSSTTTTQWVYYERNSSQRSFNVGEEARVDVDLTRLTPRITGLYMRTRQRPNAEIDTRVQQNSIGAGVGLTVPVGSRFKLDLDARQTGFDYSQGAFGDPMVAQALNRNTEELSLASRIELTSLTSVTMKAESIRDRFTLTPERDSDSIRIMPGVTFQPFAMISGSAFVGVRRFTPLSAALPHYTGVVAAVELRYTAFDTFRISGQVKRDVDYSVDLNEAFYVSTSAGVEVMQAVTLNWDVVGRIGRGSLAYPETASGLPGRTDRYRLAGVGLGRHVGDNFRIGFDVNYVKRTSEVASRAYEGLRFGGSFTYGY